MAKGLLEQTQKVQCIQEDEREEVLMITIAQAIIDEWTMVIKMLDTLMTERAVKRCLRLDNLTVGAKVV